MGVACEHANVCFHIPLSYTTHLFTATTRQGDIVLLGLRDYQEDKVDIIHKYNADEARNLKAFGELPETGACLV